MTIAITVERAATEFDVHTKTVREWIRKGMPVVESGKKGAGNGAKIDFVRAMNWLRAERGVHPPIWAHVFADDPKLPDNPLRWLIELYADDAQHMVKTGLLAWLREVRGGEAGTDWQNLGMTAKQAQRVVWDIFGWILMMLSSYKVNSFEQTRLMPLSKGADLDDLASLWFCGDTRSEWDTRVEIPPEIMAFAPEEDRAALKKLDAKKAR